MLTLDEEDYELLGYGDSASRHAEEIHLRLIAWLASERIRKREVMRAYRATKHGREATRESTKRYRKTEKGRASRSAANRKYYLKRKAAKQ